MKAEAQQTRAQTVQTYVDMSAIDPSEVRRKLAECEEFSAETMLDDYSDEELFSNMPDDAEQSQQEQVPLSSSGIFEQGSFDKYAKGNSPDAAPEATKLPQDMNSRVS